MTVTAAVTEKKDRAHQSHKDKEKNKTLWQLKKITTNELWLENTTLLLCFLADTNIWILIMQTHVNPVCRLCVYFLLYATVRCNVTANHRQHEPISITSLTSGSLDTRYYRIISVGATKEPHSPGNKQLQNRTNKLNNHWWQSTAVETHDKRDLTAQVQMKCCGWQRSRDCCEKTNTGSCCLQDFSESLRKTHSKQRRIKYA